MRTAIDMITATAMPAGVMPEEDFLEGAGLESAFRGLVGVVGVGVELDVERVVEEEVFDVVDERDAEDELVVGSDDDVSELVVLTAGPGSVRVVSLSSSSSSSSSFSFRSDGGVGVALAGLSSEVDVASISRTLVTKSSRESRTCRSSRGTARIP